jgi:hypothetical protein
MSDDDINFWIYSSFFVSISIILTKSMLKKIHHWASTLAQRTQYTETRKRSQQTCFLRLFSHAFRWVEYFFSAILSTFNRPLLPYVALVKMRFIGEIYYVVIAIILEHLAIGTLNNHLRFLIVEKSWLICLSSNLKIKLHKLIKYTWSFELSCNFTKRS